MNFLDQTITPRREAKLRYLDADFHVVREGEYVLCAATGEVIALSSLRYWDVARQVPFKSAAAAFAEHLKASSASS